MIYLFLVAKLRTVSKLVLFSGLKSVPVPLSVFLELQQLNERIMGFF